MSPYLNILCTSSEKPYYTKTVKPVPVINMYVHVCLYVLISACINVAFKYWTAIQSQTRSTFSN